MKLKIGLTQNILYQFNIFCTGTKTNCTKAQIELQHLPPTLHPFGLSHNLPQWRIAWSAKRNSP